MRNPLLKVRDAIHAGANSLPVFLEASEALVGDAVGIMKLVALTVRAERSGALPPGKELRIALVGGASLQPFDSYLKHFLRVRGIDARMTVGTYDGYVSELTGKETDVARSEPAVTVVLPGSARTLHTLHTQR